MAADGEPEASPGGPADADPRADGDPEVAGAVRWRDGEATGGEVRAVLGVGDGQGPGEVAGAARQGGRVRRDSTAPGHGGDAGRGFQRADEHAAGRAWPSRDRVQTEVEPVGAEDVGHPARAVEEGMGRRAEGGVGGGVLGAEVGLRLDDAPGGGDASEPRDEDAAQEISGDLRRRSLIETPWERGAAASRRAYRRPPFTSTMAPWTKLAASEARKRITAACSSGVDT